MSIVEKAISKLQATQRPAPSVAVVPHVGPHVRGATPPESKAERVRLPARPVIELNIESLRERGLMAPEEAHARVTDEYRRIKWPLLATAFGRESAAVERGNLVMIASCLPAEGKTFTSVNLAMAIALERDCTVLLVDADVAKPNITRDFRLEDRLGLVDALASDVIDPEELVLDTSVTGLSVLPAGQRNPRAPELLASQRMDQVAARLAADPNRIVIFDSSPLLATNEAQVVARVVGQILVVVRANDTPQQAVHEALAQLDTGKTISLLLNQMESGIGEYYGGYYGYEKQQQ